MDTLRVPSVSLSMDFPLLSFTTSGREAFREEAPEQILRRFFVKKHCSNGLWIAAEAYLCSRSAGIQSATDR